jgi:hypothetical protein
LNQEKPLKVIHLHPTSPDESTERLQILSHAAKLKKQGYDKLAIRFDVSPILFAILRSVSERCGITPSQAAYQIVADWADKVDQAMEADATAESEKK